MGVGIAARGRCRVVNEPAELSGFRLLADRYRNKGTAFTSDERDRFHLHGLLPPAVEDLEMQLDRVATEYAAKRTDLGRHVYLRALQERNTVLFYAYLSRQLESLLPVVYTPTVGLACQEWSRIYRREHGLYLSWPLRDRVDEMLDQAIDGQDMDVVVVTDGERILGLGDLGLGGMGIPIGKLALYSAVGGIDPARTLPVILDAGTDNEELLSDPLYLGWRNRRVRGDQYDELVDAFVAAIARRLPQAVVQWEDFAQLNAHRLLDRHRDRVSSFNDDIQGTAAVTAAAVAAGMGISGVPIHELRLVVVGAGSAGTGIANQVAQMLVAAGVPTSEALNRCWLVDRNGLLHSDLPDLQEFQRPFMRQWDDVAAWDDDNDGIIDLVDVVRRVGPHAIVGVTGQPGLFTEAVVRAQAEQVDRPIVLPLSNPTPRAEAIPADVIKWTDGRALIGTGSPFAPVVHDGITHEIAQVNNVYVFPGVGLGAVSVRATSITDGMFTAAASAVGELAAYTRTSPSTALLPPITEARSVARHVAIAVARAAIEDGVASAPPDGDVADLIDRVMWTPLYSK